MIISPYDLFTNASFYAVCSRGCDEIPLARLIKPAWEILGRCLQSRSGEFLEHKERFSKMGSVGLERAFKEEFGLYLELM